MSASEKYGETERLEIKLNKMELVKLQSSEIRKIARGELVYIDHPEKGIMYADYENIFINAIELSEEDKLRLQ